MTPINKLIDSSVKCAKCGAAMGGCDCWKPKMRTEAEVREALERGQKGVQSFQGLVGNKRLFAEGVQAGIDMTLRWVLGESADEITR